MFMHRPYCQPVIPLVYDDSLSYYEVLCKVIDRLNKMYAFTTDEIERILDEMGLSDAVRFKNVLNVKDFGAKGDGITDDRMAIQDALTAAYEAGGGIVFVPQGHYITSRCIIVGSNCVLMGTGEGSIIDLVDHNPIWGTAIGVMGSNCGVSSLKVLYYDYVTEPIVSGAAWGAIGATNSEYYSAVNQNPGTVKIDYENIVISNIYTEGFYSLQIEPTSKIRNVTYKDCHCEGSIMSLQAGTVQGDFGPGVIENVTVDNCICDYFRILGGNNITNVNVSNLYTHYIYTLGSGVHFNNFVVDCTRKSPFDTLQAPIADAVAKFFNLEGSLRCSASNGLIKGRKSGIPVNGLAINQYSNYDFIGITIQGFSLRNITGSSANTSCTWIGCNASEENVVNAPTGKGVASSMGTLLTTVKDAYYSDVYTDIEIVIEPAEGYAITGRTAAENRIMKNGQLVVGNVALLKSEGGLVLDQVIATIPMHPATDRYCTGIATNVNQDNSEYVSPALIKIASNGEISVRWMARHTPSNYNCVMFTIDYTIGM